MRKMSKAGFSIIEVSIVLSITFLIFVAMVATVQISISRQRYEDSLSSFKDFLQRQYEEVKNVIIDKQQGSVSGCGNPANRDNERGRTNCYVVGRLLNFSVSNGNTNIKVEQILYSTNDTSEANKLEYNDFILKDSSVLASGIITRGVTVDNYTIEWAAKLYRPRPNRNQAIDGNASVIILRSPETGIIRTYISDTHSTNSSDLRSILHASALTKNLDMCVIPSGAFVGQMRAVRLNAGASNGSGVEIMMPGTNAANNEVDCRA